MSERFLPKVKVKDTKKKSESERYKKEKCDSAS